MNRRVLVVEDEPEMARMVEVSLDRAGFDVHTANSLATATAALAEREFAVVLSDINLGDGSGLGLAPILSATGQPTALVVMTAFGSLDTAIEAIHAGAYDFLVKPVDMEAVVVSIERATEYVALQTEVHRLRRALAPGARCGAMIGESPVMQNLFTLVERLAKNPVPVLILGESGTGKELIARALHDLSPRAARPFVAVNCAAMPDTLLESELFGHNKGAFTGAGSSHEGLFLQSDGGTMFLDEAGDMGLGVQAKLLRALQEKVVRPVGATQEVPFDARIIAATNHDLKAAIKAGTFREDLYYRLNVVQLEAPPLRDRISDVPLLAKHFIDKYATRYGVAVEGLTAGAIARLVSHDWPGNVRELENAMARAVALAQYSQIRTQDLQAEVSEGAGSDSVFAIEDPALLPTAAEVERRYIEHVVRVVDGNKTAAAGVLELDRKTLYRKLEKYAEDES